jgi:hypothetical protein
MMPVLKKFSLLLACLVFINGCITVVFEPYLGEDHKLTTGASEQENLHSPSDNDQKNKDRNH